MLSFKKHPRDEGEGDLAINRISRRADRILNLIFLLWALACVLPLILVVIVSFSSEQSIFQNGYSFFPSEWSLDAYRFFFRLGDQLVRSYGITIFVTVAGTLFSLIITAMFAYVLSRADYAYNRLFTLLMLFTMLFNGGIVATYMVNTQILGLGNSLGALIFPMSLNAFYVIVLRTFYKSIPMEIIEAARLDGCGRVRLAAQVVLPQIRENVSTAVVYMGIMALDMFVYVSVMTPSGGTARSTEVVSRYLYETAFARSQFGLASAMGVVLALVTMLMAVIVLFGSRSKEDA